MGRLQNAVQQLKSKNQPILDNTDRSLGLVSLSEATMKPDDFFKRTNQKDFVTKAVSGEIIGTNGKKFPPIKGTDELLIKFKELDGEPDRGSSERVAMDKFIKTYFGGYSKIEKAANGFGGTGGSGKPTGADWEDIITHHYNILIEKPNHDPEATKKVLDKWGDYDEIGKTIAENFIPEIGKSGMTQYGRGKSSLSSFWKTPSPGVTGGTNATPKTDMYTSDYHISLKKKGGSQLASGATGETLSTFYAALQHFSTDKNGLTVIDEVMKAIQDNFTKLQTDYSKTGLEVVSKDKKKQGKLSSKDKVAFEKYIATEDFHKAFNATLIPKLDSIKDATIFKEWLIFEAMSGFSKFEGEKSKSSVCMEFSAENGSVTKFIEVTSDGKTGGLSDSPKVSGMVKKVAKKAKIYAAWKSSGKNPYSTLRISGYGEDRDYDGTTLMGCIRKTIEEDKISQAFLKEDVQQLDEFWFKLPRWITTTFNKIKGMGKDAIKWVTNLIAKIMKAVAKALAAIKKMGAKMFQGLFNFLGVTLEDTNITGVSDIQGFMNK